MPTKTNKGHQTSKGTQIENPYYPSFQQPNGLAQPIPPLISTAQCPPSSPSTPHFNSPMPPSLPFHPSFQQPNAPLPPLPPLISTVHPPSPLLCRPREKESVRGILPLRATTLAFIGDDDDDLRDSARDRREF